MGAAQTATARGSFRTADAGEEVAQLAFILDAMAAKPAVRQLRAWALETLAPGAGDTALDVGCGTGEEVAALAPLVGVITAAEAEQFTAGVIAAGERGEFHLSVTMYGVAAVKPG